MVDDAAADQVRVASVDMQVLMKSDGRPHATSHVVDDHLMEITRLSRRRVGLERKHLLLYKYAAGSRPS